MPNVSSEIRINASRSTVYQIAKDVESFPSYMPDVESVVVLERSDDSSRTVTKWVGLIPEFKQKIRWTEEDIWDDTEFFCKFKQIEGEYQLYQGEWHFIEEDSKTTIFKSSIDYDLEIPLIGALIKKLIAKKMSDNTEKILAAIKERAESTSSG